MIYFFQSLSLKVRFLAIVLLAFPVLGFQWLMTGAPWALASLKVLSNGAGVPDAELWYTPAVLNAFFAAWGPEGRALYLTVLWPTDLGFLLSYGALFTTAVLYLLKKANPSARWYLLALLPLAASAADLLENLCLGLAALLVPDSWDVVAWAAAVFTASKWTAVALTAGVLVIGSAARLLGGAWTKMKAAARGPE